MADAAPPWFRPAPLLRHEQHFGNRVLRCFAERPGSLAALFAASVARNPDGEAIVSGAERLSWRGLDALVGRLAGGFAARGIGKGDRVALLLGNGIPFVAATFAAARLGVIIVPLSLREQSEGLRYLLAHSGAALLLHETGHHDRLPPPDATPALRHRIGLDAWDDLLAAGGIDEAALVDEEDTAALLYTSGTTGRPKGAMLSHLGIVHTALNCAHGMALTMTDRGILAVPMSHVTGLVAQIAVAAAASGTMIVMREFKARDFLELAARERMTMTVLVPAMYALCLLEPDFVRYDLSAWRLGAFGGAPMSPAIVARLAERLPKLALMNAYGATETSSAATMMPPAATATRLDSVGLVLPGVDLVVMDADGREVPRGEPGEIWIAGPLVVKGYWSDPDAMDAAITGGYWHSGDIGSMDEDGFVRIHDRSKDMINRGGYKIYSVEVESVLLAHPGVIEAAVIARPCPVLGERVHAVITRRSPDIAAAALAAHCAAVLADYKVPESFTLSDTPLPRNANGKLLKRLLRERVGALT